MSYYSNRRYNPPAELKVAPHGAAPISTGMTVEEFKELLWELLFARDYGLGQDPEFNAVVEAFKKGPSQ